MSGVSPRRLVRIEQIVRDSALPLGEAWLWTWRRFGDS
jgi:hypothetical protein